MDFKKAYKSGIIMIMGILCIYFATACNNSSSLFEKGTVNEVPTLKDEYETIIESTKIVENGILVTKYFKENNIEIKYPQITKMEDSNLESQINNLLKEDALRILEYYQVNFEGDVMEVDFEVKKSNEESMSVVYTGDFIWQGAANSANLLYSSNINMETGEHICLAEEKKIDQIAYSLKTAKGYDIITDSEELLAVVEENLKEIDIEDLRLMLENADFKNKDFDSYPEIFSYYTDEGESYISFPLINTLEDYALIKLF